uniref:Uncharacterized protein n=1 Tax=Anguilla anguilla TaxID=7936 RepID=A0A0E9PZ39_ANGAN
MLNLTCRCSIYGLINFGMKLLQKFRAFLLDTVKLACSPLRRGSVHVISVKSYGTCWQE